MKKVIFRHSRLFIWASQYRARLRRRWFVSFRSKRLSARESCEFTIAGFRAFPNTIAMKRRYA